MKCRRRNLRLPLVVATSLVVAGSARAEPATLPTFLVGTPGALERWTLDGHREVVSRGPARHPRWYGPAAVVVLDSGEVERGEATVVRVDVATGKRKRIARLPPFLCTQPPGRTDEAMPISLQSEDDFVIDPSADRACLQFMDRNLNMADLVLSVQVDLNTGRITRTLEQGRDRCEVPPNVVVDEDALGTPACSRALVESPSATAREDFAHSFSDGGTLVRRQPKARRRVKWLAGYSATSTSPSGRWLLLQSEPEEGDYVHFAVYLFDRASGRLFAVPNKGSTTWLRPVELKAGQPETADIVGEDDVRWLDLGSGTDALLVRDLVLVPEQRVLHVPGEVVR